MARRVLDFRGAPLDSARVTYMIQSFNRSYGFAKVVDTVTLHFTRLREPVRRTHIPDVRLR